MRHYIQRLKSCLSTVATTKGGIDDGDIAGDDAFDEEEDVNSADDNVRVQDESGDIYTAVKCKYELWCVTNIVTILITNPRYTSDPIIIITCSVVPVHKYLTCYR